MDKKEQGYTLYQKGWKYADIADRLGVSVSAVKSWAARYWKQEKTATKGRKKVATKPQKVATKDAEKIGPQKEDKGGAPLGNVNAVGNNGGPPQGSQNALKHGGYSKLLFATFAGDKMQAVEAAGAVDEETALVEEIHLLTLRESYLLERIDRYSNPPADENGKKKLPMSVSGVVSSSDKRDFARLDKDAQKTADDRAAYIEAIDRKVASGDRLPGTANHVTSTTEANYLIVERLEKLLSDVQKQKARDLDQLSALRARRREVSEGRRTEGNNLLDAIRTCTAEEVNTDGIPELEQTATAGNDMVEPAKV